MESIIVFVIVAGIVIFNVVAKTKKAQAKAANDAKTRDAEGEKPNPFEYRADTERTEGVKSVVATPRTQTVTSVNPTRTATTAPTGLSPQEERLRQLQELRQRRLEAQQRAQKSEDGLVVAQKSDAEHRRDKEREERRKQEEAIARANAEREAAKAASALGSRTDLPSAHTPVVAAPRVSTQMQKPQARKGVAPAATAHGHADGARAEKVYVESTSADYVSEGCADHADIRYLSDYPAASEDEPLELTALQKIIAFGDLINRPRYQDI